MVAEMEKDFEQGGQRLRSDIELVNSVLEQQSEKALDAAIQRGLDQGRKRAIRGRRKRLSLTMSVSAICMILLLSAFVRVSPTFAAIMKDIPGFSGFVSFIESDKSLLSAVENDFIQTVKLSDEKNGYKFTVDGILADDQRLVILYTAEGPGINGNTGFLDYKLKTSDGADLEAGISSSHFPSNDAADTSVPVHDYLDVLIGDGQMPESLQFSLLLGGQWLRVDFPIDHERFAGMREEISINRSFEVGGQYFTVKDVIMTPLQVSLTIEADPSNAKRANSFINMVLVDEKGRRYETSSGFGELHNSFTSHFKSSYFEKPKKLTLVADGLHLSEYNQSITIDTDKMETISSPDNRLRIVDKQEVAEGYDLEFELIGLNEFERKLGYMLFSYDDFFKDAAGVPYSIDDRGRSVIGGENDTKMIFNYRIPKSDYKQPLTFDIVQYPGYVLEPISVTLK